ncbi:MAG: hypothetical protein EXQ91_09310 [Alphaproteobacteria bacterium]|nr:hypothetical protein [Alphaproteobacteria bacterium]
MASTALSRLTGATFNRQWRELTTAQGRRTAGIGACLGAIVATALLTAGSLFETNSEPTSVSAAGSLDATVVEDRGPEKLTRSEAATRSGQDREAIAVDLATTTIRIAKGESLSQALARAGVASGETKAVSDALRLHVNLRRLDSGQPLTLDFEPQLNGQQRRLAMVSLPLNIDATIVARRTADGFKSRREDRDVQTSVVRIVGAIDNSLFASAQTAGMPARTIMDFVRLFSWDIDFQRGIQPGDKFEVLYEQFHADPGRAAKIGDIMFAALTAKGESIKYYRYRAASGVDYFNNRGESMRKALLGTPLDGARLTSGFGKRTHPILGYTHMHRGGDDRRADGRADRRRR